MLLEIGLGRLARELVGAMPRFPVSKDWERNTVNIRHFFIFIADNVLAGRMGDRYATITRTCLVGNMQDCLEKDSGDFKVGVEKALRDVVVNQLEELAVLF